MGDATDVFSFTAGEAEVEGGESIGAVLARLGDEREDIVIVSPDLSTAPVAGLFAARHPERTFDCGIAEANAMSIAAGLAASGFIPFVVQMGAFSALKCGEQIRTDMAYTQLPVRILSAWSGLAMGYFGTSHHAVEDIAITRSITGLTVVAPSDPQSATALLRSTLDHRGPVFFRIGSGDEGHLHDKPPAMPRGKFLRLREGSRATIIATGMATHWAIAAADILAGEGICVRVLDAVYLKPLDEEAILAAARDTGGILTVEEHNVVGGLGTAVADVLARNGVAGRLGVHGLPDEDLLVGQPPELYAHYDLTPQGVAAKVRELLNG
ncbi:MAG: transketolase family protein [Novosphingobium sp.]|nr:transketolase family protein [Novosphingobium sp.]